MSSRQFFFATREDLEPGLEAIEVTLNLQYVWMRSCSTRNVDSYLSAFDIPDFGKVRDRISECYIVLPRSDGIVTRRVVEIPKYSPKFFGVRPGWRRDLAVGLATVGLKLPDGNIRYDVCPVDHPSSIQFWPGGQNAGNVLIRGEIAANPNSKKSIDLYEHFSRLMFNHFDHIKMYHVGPNAVKLLNQGFRLTSDAKAAVDYDLQR